MEILYKPENEAEALALTALLEENCISSSTESFHDSAYDGLYQAQRGWGVIRAAEADFDRATKLIEDWKSGMPDSNEIEGYTDYSSSSSDVQTSRMYGFKYILAPALFGLSLLLNIYFVVQYLSDRYAAPTDYDQYDMNNRLMVEVQWGDNKNSPFQSTYYLVNGDVENVTFDTNDDGRTDQFVVHHPTGKSLYFDEDKNGIFERCETEFETGSRAVGQDNDQNRIFEKTILTTRGGKTYHLKHSNVNGWTFEITTPAGKPVDFSVLKQIAYEL